MIPSGLVITLLPAPLRATATNNCDPAGPSGGGLGDVVGDTVGGDTVGDVVGDIVGDTVGEGEGDTVGELKVLYLQRRI